MSKSSREGAAQPPGGADENQMRLQETAERLEAALESGAIIGTWVWDVLRDDFFADERFARFFGLDPERCWSGLPLEDVMACIHDDDRSRVAEAIAGVLGSGGPYRCEYRVRRHDGLVRWVEASGRVELNAHGEAVRFPGVLADIQGRRDAEADRDRATELLRSFVQAVPGVVYAKDLAGRMLFGNQGTTELIGMPPELYIGRTDMESLKDKTQAATVMANDRRIMDSGVTEQIEEDVKLPDGTPVRWLSTKAPLRNEAGRIIGLIGSSVDITARKRAEEALIESEAQFRAVSEAIPSHVWAARPNGELYWFNAQAYAYSGGGESALGGPASWVETVHRDDIAEAVAAWERSLSSGDHYETELRIRRADGVFRWFLVRAAPVRLADGSISRWIGTNTDIDDQKRQAGELARLNESLEDQVVVRTAELMAAEETLRQSQKMEAVGQLTGGLAHDFNNLLTGITGSLELLLIRLRQGRMGEVERFVGTAQGAAKRAAALTHRLLAFSRRQTLDPKPTDMNRLVASMEELIQRTVGPSIAVETVAAGGLWNTLVDGGQLENALLNLCINAKDAMPDGGKITIETANRWLDDRVARERELPAGQYVSLCVSDTGVGMPADVIARAFDPFFTTKPIGMGTGLGLSMIYGFVRQSGGQARIYSEVGTGTMVCLYLPRHLGALESAENVAYGEADMLSSTSSARNGETVLVIDDEPSVRMLVSEVLQELGYCAIEAADGIVGMRVLESDRRLDLLVTDVGLPGGMNGRQIADAARAMRPGLKVLFITGYAENAVLNHGHLEAGMHVLTKPFAMDALALRIKRLVGDGGR